MEIGYDLALVSTQLLLTDFDRYESSGYADGDGGGPFERQPSRCRPMPAGGRGTTQGKAMGMARHAQTIRLSGPGEARMLCIIFPRTTSTQAKGIGPTPTHAKQRRKKRAWPHHFPIRAVTGHACDHSLFVTCQAVLSCHRCSPIPIRQTSFQVLKSLIFPTHRLW